MEKKNDRVYATIDLAAVEENFKQMKENLTPGTKMIAVVKANGYGHGALPVAEKIEDYEYIWGFAVATAHEASQLRNGGIRKPILVLGYVFPEDYDLLVSEDIRPAVFRLEMAQALSACAVKQNRTVSIHLAIDTGMTRIGYRNLEEFRKELVHMKELPNVKIEGIFTHFARADEEDLSYAQVQFERFQEFMQCVKEVGVTIPLKHCNNSAGILWHREGDLDAVRPGITIYGLSPSDEVINPGVKLHPVMSLTSHVSCVKWVEAGVPVSYGGTFVTDKETCVATVPVGYADGYPRSLSNVGEVLIHGKRARILGRVCMDQFMVDVTDIEEVKVCDKVILMGRDGKEEISVEELSERSGRFPYEFICCISQRVPRIYQN